MNSKKKHEPKFHIAKRDDLVWWKSWLIRICAGSGGPDRMCIGDGGSYRGKSDQCLCEDV